MQKYKRIKTIGKGAFGEAVLVKCLADGNLYVSKEIDLHGLSQKDRDATDNEIRILATVDHPNITKFIESIQEDTTIFIMLEYADGGDLHDQIKRQQLANLPPGTMPFPELQIRNWFVQICLAIQHLHSKKILHRDLKTRNVFMTKTGQIKLGDFGLSTVLEKTMGQASTLCGTPYYFSPELCRNKPYNSKSDVWALGCILYEMCTLRHAFDGKNMKMLMQKILKGVYNPIPSMYSQELSNLIKFILVRDEAKRPSVTQILEVPWMQTSLKILVHNLSQMTEEEEKESEKKCLATENLLTEASRNIQGAPRPARSMDGSPREDHMRQLQDLKSMRNADPGAFKAFLKRPPPAEVAAEIQAVLKANEEQQRAACSPGRSPRLEAPLPVEAVPEPEPSEKVEPCGTMKLARCQYKTIQQQITKLMCEGDGARCQAAQEEEAEEQPPLHPPETPTCRADALRRHLQQTLGLPKFKEAYAALRAVTEADPEEEVLARIAGILGPQETYRTAITQLLALEDEACAH